MHVKLNRPRLETVGQGTTYINYVGGRYTYIIFSQISQKLPYEHLFKIPFLMLEN
jgi:hypothetical protein